MLNEMGPLADSIYRDAWVPLSDGVRSVSRCLSLLSVLEVS
jgi:hypothetical protein